MLSHASQVQRRVIILIQASYCINSNVMTIRGEFFLFYKTNLSGFGVVILSLMLFLIYRTTGFQVKAGEDMT